jgi:hypothetical protein
VRDKPHDYTSIGPGIALGYRRLSRGAGRWVVRWADGKGGNKIKNVGAADDFEDADGEHILDYGQAIDRARRYARSGGTDTGSGRPATVAAAIDAYERDLLSRGRSPINASRLRAHTAPIAGGCEPRPSFQASRFATRSSRRAATLSAALSARHVRTTVADFMPAF